MPRRYFTDWMPKQKQNHFWAEPAASFQLSSLRFQSPIYANWVFRSDRATALHRWMEVDKRCEMGGFFFPIFNLFQSTPQSNVDLLKKWEVLEAVVTRWKRLLFSLQLLSIKNKWSNLTVPIGRVTPPPGFITSLIARQLGSCLSVWFETEAMFVQRLKAPTREGFLPSFHFCSITSSQRNVAIETCHSITVAAHSPHSRRAAM